MQLKIHTSIEEFAPADWNRVAGTDNPFMRYEFLAALEHHGCTGKAFGWLPQHAGVYDDNARLLGTAPMYLKDNSYGEFVFDWSWADAYQRAGLRYYPKLVIAAPYTPATGPRLLVDPDQHPLAVKQALGEGTVEYARELGVSSLHWLFTDEDDTRVLEQQGLLRRAGCQYHWFNRGYRDFDDFLDAFTSSKRKKLKRERRRVAESGLEIDVIHGHEATEEQLATAEMFYRTTFDRKWGVATLNLPFFQEIASTMGEQLVLIMARDRDRYVAGAICLRSSDTLYGRHWGCIADYHSLHFELCYYQGLEYCINQGLQRFEPGAQGEHKVSRGFLPTPTWSAHWVSDDRFHAAIADFLERETWGIQHYMEELSEHTPYKEPPEPAS